MIVCVYWSVFFDHSIFVHELDFCASEPLGSESYCYSTPVWDLLSVAGHVVSIKLHSHSSALYLEI